MTDPRDPGDPDALSAAEVDLLERARAAYVEWPVAAPPGLLEPVLDTVRTVLRPSRRLPMPGGDAATRRFVTDLAVANALRSVLDGDPAVVARRCRVETAAPADGLRIWLSVAVSYDHYDRHGDALVRARVIDAVRALFGQAVEVVDIDVVDVFTTRPGVSR